MISDTTISSPDPERVLGLFIQPACLQHRYIRHANSSHIFERPERLRAVLLGVAAAVARLEDAQADVRRILEENTTRSLEGGTEGNVVKTEGDLPFVPSNDLSSMMSSLSIKSSASTTFSASAYLDVVAPPLAPSFPGQLLLHHPALQLAHSPPTNVPILTSVSRSSLYLENLVKWASEAVEKIKQTGSEIPQGLGLNQSDLYLGPGSILAIEGAVS